MRNRSFFRCHSGTSAIEFAIIVPVLALVAVALSDASSLATQADQMQSAVRASIQYAMNGGTSLTSAQSQGVSAWSNKPANGTLAVSEACYCGASGGTCGALCPDGSVTSAYVTATAQAVIGGSVLSLNKTVSETVRIQ